MSDEPTAKNIRPLSRFITTHDDSGKARFSNRLPESLPVSVLSNGEYSFGLAYTTSDGFPVSFQHDQDLESYEENIKAAPGLSISTGSVCRVVDMAPGITSAMHRTISLDYGVVLEGEVELILDSGEVRTLRRGDIAIQRGTNHAWRNVTPGGWARMLYVLLPSTPLVVEGRGLLVEEVSGIDVREST